VSWLIALSLLIAMVGMDLGEFVELVDWEG